MRKSSLSALIDLFSKLLRLVNTTTDLQLHPFSFFNQKFRANKSKLKHPLSFVAKAGRQQNTSGSKVWSFGDLGYMYPYNMNKKNMYACVHIQSYTCMCTYVCTCMHYIYVCAFFSRIGKISLTHLDFFTFYAWGRNLSLAVLTWMETEELLAFFHSGICVALSFWHIIQASLHRAPVPNTHHFQAEMEYFPQVKILRWPCTGKSFW